MGVLVFGRGELADEATEWAAAIETVYPRVLHQRCWVHPARRDGVFCRRCGSATSKR
jgi:hypothetical protein